MPWWAVVAAWWLVLDKLVRFALGWGYNGRMVLPMAWAFWVVQNIVAYVCDGGEVVVDQIPCCGWHSIWFGILIDGVIWDDFAFVEFNIGKILAYNHTIGEHGWLLWPSDVVLAGAEHSELSFLCYTLNSERRYPLLTVGVGTKDSWFDNWQQVRFVVCCGGFGFLWWQVCVKAADALMQVCILVRKWCRWT